MSTILKYRIHELAKDFGVPSKVIMDILAKFGTIPKNHMQILTDDELNYIFDSLTQENQTVDINEALMAQLKRQEVKPVPKRGKTGRKNAGCKTGRGRIPSFCTGRKPCAGGACSCKACRGAAAGRAKTGGAANKQPSKPV